MGGLVVNAELQVESAWELLAYGHAASRPFDASVGHAALARFLDRAHVRQHGELAVAEPCVRGSEEVVVAGAFIQLL